MLSKARSDTGGLDFEIKIKEGARVMLTTNIDIADKLINGQMGTAMKIYVNKLIQKPSIIYIKFDDERAGKTLIQTSGDSFAQENKVVPVEPVLSKIKVHPDKPSSPELQRIQFPITLAIGHAQLIKSRLYHFKTLSVLNYTNKSLSTLDKCTLH